MNDQVTSLVNKVQDCEHNFYIHATPTAAAAASPVNLVIDRHSHNRPRWLSSAGRRCISALSLRWPKHVTANRIIDHVLKRDPNGPSVCTDRSKPLGKLRHVSNYACFVCMSLTIVFTERHVFFQITQSDFSKLLGAVRALCIYHCEKSVGSFRTRFRTPQLLAGKPCHQRRPEDRQT